MAKKVIGIENFVSFGNPGHEDDDVVDEELGNQGNNDTDGDEGEEPESQESVGDDDSEEESPTDEGSGSSPNKYTAYARTAVEEGDFVATEEEINSVVDLDSWKQFQVNQAKKAIGDEARFMYESVHENGAPKDEMTYLNEMYKRVNSITEEHVSAEDENGESVRRGLIEQDYLNRGYSEEKARKMAQRSFDSGTDVEDATEALESLKSYYGSALKNMSDNAARQRKAYEDEQRRRYESLKENIINGKDAFGGVDVDVKMRKQIMSIISDKVASDKNGRGYNAIQKFMAEDYDGAMKLFAFACAATDFGKDWGKLVKTSAKKEVAKTNQDWVDLIEGNSDSGKGIHVVGATPERRGKTGKVSVAFDTLFK